MGELFDRLCMEQTSAIPSSTNDSEISTGNKLKCFRAAPDWATWPKARWELGGPQKKSNEVKVFILNIESPSLFPTTWLLKYWQPGLWLPRRRLEHSSLKKVTSPRSKTYKYWQNKQTNKNHGWLASCPRLKPPGQHTHHVHTPSNTPFRASLLNMNRKPGSPNI